MDKIARIRQEIERLREIGGIVPLDNREQKTGYESALIDIETFLDTIESETPMQEDLENEIDKIWETCEPVDEGMGVETANIHIEQFDYLARHFAEWGAEHFRDLTKKMGGSSETPKDLEEAAGDYASDSTGFIDMTAFRAFIAGSKWQAEHLDDLEQRWNELQTNFREINEAFEAGKKEQKEQILKDAVEGTYNNSDWGTPCIDLPSPLELERFDKVKIIIVK